MRIVVATHGHCFDGLASAALFTRLLTAQSPSAAFEYRACGYGVEQRHAVDGMLTGDSNAILDYRFAPVDQLAWYFDHHKTAFGSAEDRAYFEAHESERQFYFDASYSSCTKLVADVSRDRFGLDSDALAPLVAWADRIDSAAFGSAEEAVDHSHPVRQLASVVERHGDDALLAKLVPRLLTEPLENVAKDREIKKRFDPIARRHDRFVERVRNRGQDLGRVVLVDLTDSVLDTIGKFVTYALFPNAVYSVVVAMLKRSAKISIGYNPWCGQPRDADISAICARHGGGGHAVVGAIQFRAEDLDQARSVARQIAAELNG